MSKVIIKFHKLVKGINLVIIKNSYCFKSYIIDLNTTMNSKDEKQLLKDVKFYNLKNEYNQLIK